MVASVPCRKQPPYYYHLMFTPSAVLYRASSHLFSFSAMNLCDKCIYAWDTGISFGVRSHELPPFTTVEISILQPDMHSSCPSFNIHRALESSGSCRRSCPSPSSYFWCCAACWTSSTCLLLGGSKFSTTAPFGGQGHYFLLIYWYAQASQQCKNWNSQVLGLNWGLWWARCSCSSGRDHALWHITTILKHVCAALSFQSPSVWTEHLYLLAASQLYSLIKEIKKSEKKVYVLLK